MGPDRNSGMIGRVIVCDEGDHMVEFVAVTPTIQR
jgi:hypothetical protein